MGRASGFFTANGVGMRVSNQLSFTPAYVQPNGTFINQRVKIPVGVNGFKSKATGKAPVHFFTLVAWGGRADLCCKNLTKGRAIDVELRPESYLSNYYIGNQMLLGTDGQPIKINKVQFRVTNILLAEEGYELIAEEIRTGRRPINWDMPKSPAQDQWKSICQTRNRLPYDGGDVYGYARVFKPAQGTIILNPVEYKEQLRLRMGGAQFVPTANLIPQSLPNQVAAAFTPAPAPVVPTQNTMFGNGGFAPKPVGAAAMSTGQPGHLPF